MRTLLDSFVNCSPGSKPCPSWQRGRGWCTRGRWWWGGQRLPSGRLKDATSSRTPRPKTWTATWRLLRLPSRLREFNICMWWGKILLDFPLGCTIGACDDSTKNLPLVPSLSTFLQGEFKSFPITQSLNLTFYENLSESQNLTHAYSKQKILDGLNLLMQCTQI